MGILWVFPQQLVKPAQPAGQRQIRRSGCREAQDRETTRKRRTAAQMTVTTTNYVGMDQYLLIPFLVG